MIPPGQVKLWAMAWKNLTRVHVLSPHPLVLRQLQRSLEQKGLAVDGLQLEHNLRPGAGALETGPGSLCIVDACFAPVATEALVAAVVSSCPPGRVLVLAEELSDRVAFPLLRLGVKGLLAYANAGKQLFAALGALAKGGCWVPRSAVSRFLDSLLHAEAPRTLQDPSALSHREQVVLAALLRNLSNKEIGNELNISERTVKFHVSNLLSKFSVARRSDLILRSLQLKSPTHWPPVQPSPLYQVPSLDQ